MTFDPVNPSEKTSIAVEALHAHLIARQLARPDSLGFEEVDTLFSKALMQFLLDRVSRAFYSMRKQTEDAELAQMGFLQLYPRLGCGITHSLHAGYVDRALRYQNINLYRQHRRNGGQLINQTAIADTDLSEADQYHLSSAAPAPLHRSILSGDGARLLHQLFRFGFLEGIVFRLWFDRMSPAEIVARLNSFQLTVEQGGIEQPLPAQTLADVDRLLHAARARIDQVIDAALPLRPDLTRHQSGSQRLRRQILQLQNSGLTLEECSLRLEAQGVAGGSVSNLSRKRGEALEHLADAGCRDLMPMGVKWDRDTRSSLIDWLDRFFKALQRRAAAVDSHYARQQDQAELELQHDTGFNWETRRNLLLMEPGLSPRERGIIQSLDAETLPAEIAGALRLARDVQAAALAGDAGLATRLRRSRLTAAEKNLLSLLALHVRYSRLAENTCQEARRVF